MCYNTIMKYDITEIDTKDKLNKVLLDINPDAWEIARLKSRGHSVHDIYRKYDCVYSFEDISYMIKSVIACNKFVAIDNPDMLRQLLLDEMDELKKELLNNTGGVVDEKVFNAIMKSIELRAKLLGLNAPERKEIDVVTTIRNAGEVLSDKISNWRKQIIPAEVIKDE